MAGPYKFLGICLHAQREMFTGLTWVVTVTRGKGFGLQRAARHYTAMRSPSVFVCTI